MKIGQMVMRDLVKLMTSRWYWLCLALLGLFMESVALYYQYVLGDEPCQVCIHIRIWVAAFTLLAMTMALLPRLRSLVIGAHTLVLVSATGLWERCKYLLDVENGVGDGSCEFVLGFPDWFALDSWFPWIFEVRNLCGFTPMMPFGITMAESLFVVATVLVVVALIVLVVNILALTS